MVTRKNQFDFDFDKKKKNFVKKNGNPKHRNCNPIDGNGNPNAQNCNTKVLSVYCTILYDFRNGNPNEKW